MIKPLCIIVGYGAGVGQGIALAFGEAGFRLDPGLIGQAFLKVYNQPPAEHEPELLFKG